MRKYVMSKYYDKLRKEIKEYFKMLSPDYPEWLNEYIETKELLKQDDVNTTCGLRYTKLLGIDYPISSFEHSIGVALVVWHFTHDKKQTIAGLLHDISTPAFKHCIDFLNGDYLKQESTEELTVEVIKNSKEIMGLLKRDGISLEEVCDYHIYPICDNDLPKLSADRLEYSLCHGYFTYKLNTFAEIKEMYNDIEIQNNEFGEIELGFKTKKIARNFVKMTSLLSVLYRCDKARYSMSFITEILRRLNKDGLISVKDLYEKKEEDILTIIEKSKYGEIFNKWRNATLVYSSKEKPKDVFYVKQRIKVRYIDPLFNGKRISSECKIAKRMIDKNLAYDMDNYVYLDFNI